jgi:predicted nucleotidyltransferase component of viral defense system
MENYEKIIGYIVSSTGIDYELVKYDIELTNLIKILFTNVRARNSLRLFGGTAINRGFILEKQRLSTDLDIDVIAISLEDAYKNIKEALAGYKVLDYDIVSENDELRHIVFYADRGVAKPIKIELVVQDLDFEKMELTLHPMLEYFGFPVDLSVKVPSYRLEGLLARKFKAFYERTIYRDLYDIYFSITKIADANLFKKYVDAASDGSYTYESYKTFLKSIKPAEISRKAEGLDDTYKVQLKYRIPARSMLNYIIAMMP